MKKTTRNYILKEFDLNGVQIQKSDSFPASSIARAKQLATKTRKLKGSTIELFNLGRRVAIKEGSSPWELCARTPEGKE
jgi:hypothetical protein